MLVHGGPPVCQDRSEHGYSGGHESVPPLPSWGGHSTLRASHEKRIWGAYKLVITGRFQQQPQKPPADDVIYLSYHRSFLTEWAWVEEFVRSTQEPVGCRRGNLCTACHGNSRFQTTYTISKRPTRASDHLYGVQLWVIFVFFFFPNLSFLKFYIVSTIDFYNKGQVSLLFIQAHMPSFNKCRYWMPGSALGTGVTDRNRGRWSCGRGVSGGGAGAARWDWNSDTATDGFSCLNGQDGRTLRIETGILFKLISYFSFTLMLTRG